MKTTTIPVHNGNQLDVFVEKKNDGFELWTVGTIKGTRQVLDHHLTHDDLEKRLHYQKPGDLSWEDTIPSKIPTEKHANAIEMEGTIKRRKRIDQPSVVAHLGFGSIDLLGMERKTLNATKAAIMGRWTDGQVMLILEPNNKLEISSLGSRPNFFDNCWPPSYPTRDWWNFAMWRFHTLNKEKQIGQTMAVLRVDEQELHFYSNTPDQMAHVFKRAS